MNKVNLLESFAESRDNEESPMVAAFGYGSGVYKQKNHTASMIDTIFVVKNPREWHKVNMKNNPKDYPLTGKIMLKLFNLNRIKCLTGVTYQSHIPFSGEKFKYGVVSEDRFIKNLQVWDHFFIPGRLQKPVVTIKTNPIVEEAMVQNRENALLAAILTMKNGHNATLEDLYVQICGLSYRGDFFRIIFEKKTKRRDTVLGSFDDFVNIYGTNNKFFHIEKKDNIDFSAHPSDKVVIDYAAILETVEQLPDDLKNYLDRNGYFQQSWKKIGKGINNYLTFRNLADGTLAQPATGLMTIGLPKGIVYSVQKIIKRFRKK